ncbi:hypothetical protein TDB9533_00874 [Thalassocella blandensis]|nr:hypothetical protein TDB9533_00874 [Thalassocella blandensis]
MITGNNKLKAKQHPGTGQLGFELLLSPPRGCLSTLTLLGSGFIAVVFALFMLMLWLTGESFPSVFVWTPLISAIIFAATYWDRVSAQKEGLRLWISSADQSIPYQLLLGEKILNEGDLKETYMMIAPLPLPGRVGTLVVPTYAWVMQQNNVPEDYLCKLPEIRGIVLMSATKPSAVTEAIDAFCALLDIDRSLLPISVSEHLNTDPPSSNDE